MAMWYWSVAILFWQLSIDHIVNGQYKRYGFAKTHLRHPSLPFDSLPYPTRTIYRRVRTYVRSVSHVTTKRKEVDHILWVWGSIPRALRARGSPANNLLPHTFNTTVVTNHEVHTYNTRNANTYRPYFCRTNIKQFTILHLGPKVWNSLPHNLTELTSYSSFKTSLKIFLIKRAIN